MAQGKANAAIAAQLVLSERPVGIGWPRAIPLDQHLLGPRPRMGKECVGKRRGRQIRGQGATVSRPAAAVHQHHHQLYRQRGANAATDQNGTGDGP